MLSQTANGRAGPTHADPFLREAIAIGDDLAASAISYGEYTNWVGRQILEGASKPNEVASVARALPFSMYSGLAGVSLFLGNLWRFTRDPAHYETARGGILDAVRQVQVVLDDPSPAKKKEVFGFYSGAVGVYWAAHELSSILQDGYLAERAAFLVDGLRGQLDNKDVETDVIGGHAGAIPALLSLHRNHGVKEARELAEALADRLVEGAIKKDSGAWGWGRAGRQFNAPLTGFTHGAAGYAYAFARLYKDTGNAKWKDAANAALLYERESFDPVLQAWPDFRYAPDADGRHRCAAIWCHGAGGIGLSRVLLQPILQDPHAHQEAFIARAATARQVRERLEVPGALYHLCHGVAGNAECIWVMEAGLGLPGALTRAREIGYYGIERFGHVAKARWNSRFVDWPSPHPGHRELSLLTGIAGIGYANLRLHAPDQVPTVLVPGVSWKEAAEVPYASPGESVGTRAARGLA